MRNYSLYPATSEALNITLAKFGVNIYAKIFTKEELKVASKFDVIKALDRAKQLRVVSSMVE